MPEMTVYRKDTAPPPMVCMYCGAAGAVVREWHEENRKPTPGGGGGTDLPTVPAGDDPVSAAVGLLLLPFALWELLKGLVAGAGAVTGWLTRPRPAAAPPPPSPPKPPPTTRVVITACDKHRRFADRFWWAGAGLLLLLAALWAWAGLVLRRDWGTDHTDLAATLTLIAVAATFVLQVALAFWYVLAGPVIVDRVTEGTVTLDRVRRAYFDATGVEPGDAA